MQCAICGQKNAYIRKIDRTYGKGKHTFVIRNIPLATCSTCDERYFKTDIFDNAKQLSPTPELRVNEPDAICLA
jgi:YgiT-type zinc finger domain-containing protein